MASHDSTGSKPLQSWVSHSYCVKKSLRNVDGVKGPGCGKGCGWDGLGCAETELTGWSCLKKVIFPFLFCFVFKSFKCKLISFFLFSSHLKSAFCPVLF